MGVRRIALAVQLFCCVAALGKATVHAKDGEQLIIDFPTGPRGYVYLVREPLYEDSIPFQIVDNTCSTQVGMHCKLEVSMGVDRLFTLDLPPDKVKEAKFQLHVKRIDPNAPNALPLSHIFLYSGSDKKAFPKITKDVKPLRFNCSDYSWLPGEPKQAPDKVRLTRWDVEGMFGNPETGMTENRTLSYASQVDLKKNTDGMLEVTDSKLYSGNLFFLSFGGIYSLVMPHPDGDFCQVSLKADYIKLQNGSVALLSKFSGDFQPYLWNQDEHSALNTTNFFFGGALLEFLKNPGEYEYTDPPSNPMPPSF